MVRIKEWHSDLLAQLSVLVKEEIVPSKTILFKESSSAIAAYNILKGRLSSVGSKVGAICIDFTDGMWIGEMAFMSATRRRWNFTVATVTLTRLMMVPCEGFHELLSSLGLKTRFNTFRETHLEQGLCGRCGSLGDHFTHACPKGSSALSSATSMAWLRRHKEQQLKRWMPGSSSPEWVSEEEHDGTPTITLRLEDVLPLLQSQGVETLEELRAVKLEDLLREAGEDAALLTQVELLQTLQAEQREHELFASNRDEMMSQHLVFLSHYKNEAGTEAALMRTEFEQIMKKDRCMDLSQFFTAPIFLDSEDLFDLEELQVRVQKSHNLLLLLTDGVLLRPWVLVELVTAVRNAVRVVLVTVSRQGLAFTFPDEGWYTALLAGEVLDESGEALLQEHGIQLIDVEQACRHVFKKIALPYSPHRPESIRTAEIRALLKQIRIRSLAEGTGGETEDASVSLDCVTGSFS